MRGGSEADRVAESETDGGMLTANVARNRLMAETKGDGKSRVLAAKTGPLLRGNSTGNLVT